MIEKAPLQVYVSAIMFCPRKSAIWEYYASDFPPWVIEMDGVPDDMNPALQAFGEISQTRLGLAISPDSRYLASIVLTGLDSGVDLRDSVTGVSKQILPINRDESCGSLVFSPNGKFLAARCRPTYSSTPFDNVAIWNTGTGAFMGSTRLANTFPYVEFKLIFASDNTLIVTWFERLSRRLSVTQVNTMTLDHTLAHLLEIPYIAGDPISTEISNDGRLQALAYSDFGQKDYLGLWDIAIGSQRWIYQIAGTEAIRQIKFAGNNAILLTLSKSDTIRLWNLHTGSCLRSITALASYTKRFSPLAISSTGEALAVASSTGAIYVWRWLKQTGRGDCGLIKHYEQSSELRFSPDDASLASLSSPGNVITVLDLSNLVQPLPQATDHQSNVVKAMKYHSGESLVASGNSEGGIDLWSLRSGTVEFMRTLTGHNKPILDIGFSKNGRMMISFDVSGTYCLWDLRSDHSAVLKQLVSYDRNREQIGCACVAFASQKNIAICIFQHKASLHIPKVDIHLLNLDTLGSSAFQPEKDDKLFHYWKGTAALSSDASLLAVLCSDGSSGHPTTTIIRIMDMATRALKHTIILDWTEFRFGSYDLWFSEDGTELETYYGSIPLTSTGKEKFHPLLKNDLQLATRNDWVWRGHERLVYLPTDYRTTHWAADGDVLVLKIGSGRIVYMKFLLP